MEFDFTGSITHLPITHEIQNFYNLIIKNMYFLEEFEYFFGYCFNQRLEDITKDKT